MCPDCTPFGAQSQKVSGNINGTYLLRQTDPDACYYYVETTNAVTKTFGDGVCTPPSIPPDLVFGISVKIDAAFRTVLAASVTQEAFIAAEAVGPCTDSFAIGNQTVACGTLDVTNGTYQVGTGGTATVVPQDGVNCSIDGTGLATSYTVDTSAIVDSFCSCAASADPAWDGVLTQSGPLVWLASPVSKSIGGVVFADAQLALYTDPVLSCCYWVLCIRCYSIRSYTGTSFIEIWSGRKEYGNTPAGIYFQVDPPDGLTGSCQPQCTDGGGNYNPPKYLTVS